MSPGPTSGKRGDGRAREQRVRIVGDHPHRGSTGTVRDDLPMKFGMWQVDLDDGRLASGCFAGPESLRSLPREEDPHG